MKPCPLVPEDHMTSAEDLKEAGKLRRASLHGLAARFVPQRRSTIAAAAFVLGVVAASAAWHLKVPSLIESVDASNTTALVLPGRIQAAEENAVYALIDGHVERVLVDVGDRVQSGQVLAV